MIKVLIQISLSYDQVTPNKKDISLRKLKIRSEKCDIIETCLKIPTLLKLNRMISQGSYTLISQI
jgi:hypothetical protein